MKIYKTILDLRKPTQKQTLSGFASLLSVQNQNEKLCVWWLHDIQKTPAVYEFRIAETGEHHDTLTVNDFFGTVQFQGGIYVVHVFARNVTLEQD